MRTPGQLLSGGERTEVEHARTEAGPELRYVLGWPAVMRGPPGEVGRAAAPVLLAPDIV